MVDKEEVRADKKKIEKNARDGQWHLWKGKAQRLVEDDREKGGCVRYGKDEEDED